MSDSITGSSGQLHKAFGQNLYGAAERLVDSGCVLDVRVLQAGAVVTGVVGTEPQATGAARYRVYIRQPNGAAARECECSCGDRNPCVHAAAVLIAAARGRHSAAPGNQRGGSTEAASRASSDARRPVPQAAERHASQPPGADNTRGTDPAATRVQPQVAGPRLTSSSPAQQQRLYYLLKSAPRASGQGTDPLHLSIWVGWSASGSAHMQPGTACAFVPRAADGAGYPRYVDAQDIHILQALSQQQTDGIWELRGPLATRVLRDTVATGRAVWQSLEMSPLRVGAPRPASFTWKALTNGDQQLSDEAEESMSLLLHAEPPVYIDGASNEWGLVQLSYPLDLLRHSWDHPPVPPERVAEVNERIALWPGSTGFPLLRLFSVQRQERSTLRARLVLCTGPEATLHFIYNGFAVDSHTMNSEHSAARVLAGDIVYEIPRDHEAELRMQAQLEHVRPDSPHDMESWLRFMIKAVPALQADGWELATDVRFPYRVVIADDWYADLQTQRRDEWFDLKLGATVEGRPVNLLPALVSYLQATAGKDDESCRRIEEQLFIRLDDGRYLPVPIERIQRIAETLVELFDQDGLNDKQALALPRSQASRVAQLFQEQRGPALRSNDGSMLALIEEIKDFTGIRPLSAPRNFAATLRPYQEEGLGWLQFLRRYRLGGILADDMGLGKTVQTLAHLVLEKEHGRLGKPSLIVAPVSVIGNWQQEIRRFAPALNVLTLHGSRRKELFGAIGKADVVITGYPLLLLDSEVLLAHELCFLILDEAQTVKNPRAKVSQMARALRAEHRLCLTGTPMENHLGELWSLFDFLQPGFLGDEKQFQRHYRAPIEKNSDTQRAEALGRRVAPFILRRTKDAVAKELPPRTQIVESIVMEEKQRDFYDGIRLAMHRRVREIIEQQGLARSQITVLDALLKLRQACCDPRLVNRDNAQEEPIPSAKMEWLTTVLPELVAEGRRILLFSQFTSMLRLIEAAVTAFAIPYFTLTGETRERTPLVERFQAGEVPLFLISLKAGGTGLNLTAADTVIHYDPWWNPAVEAQATDRAHRIGQDKPVFVYKLITQGTVEERIMQLQNDKHALASRLYSEQSGSPSHLEIADLEALFAP